MGAQASSPILVTGAHRSGTTWVGAVLGDVPGVAHVHEPMNPEVSVDGEPSPASFWFEGVTRRNRRKWTCFFDRILERRAGSVVLWKDPIALFAAEWLHRRYKARVVAMVRHPLGFAGSVKVKGWNHDFDDFLKQPRLMRRMGKPERRLVEAYAADLPGVVDQAVLLWRLIYGEVDRWKNRPWCRVVVHEHLSRRPLDGFRELFDWLGLPYGAEQMEKVRVLSEGEDRADGEGGFGLDDVCRDSAANLERWRTRLTEAEAETVRRATGPLADRFYGEGGW